MLTQAETQLLSDVTSVEPDFYAGLLALTISRYHEQQATIWQQSVNAPDPQGERATLFRDLILGAYQDHQTFVNSLP